MKKYLSLIKFSHTIFALPFAIIGFFLSYPESNISYLTFIYVILCMVFARSAAMAFNRYIDRDIDTINPRTSEIREIPSKKILLNPLNPFFKWLNSPKGRPNKIQGPQKDQEANGNPTKTKEKRRNLRSPRYPNEP